MASASVSSFSVTISHPISASDEQESAYLSRTRTLHWVRIGIAFMLFSASAVVVGTEAAPLHYYNQTKSYSNFYLPLWPLNLDIRQTNALLACGVVILFEAFVYIIIALLPSVRVGPFLHLSCEISYVLTCWSLNYSHILLSDCSIYSPRRLEQQVWSHPSLA